MKLQKLINELLDYGLKKNILDERDLVYSTNLLIDIFGIHEFERIPTAPRTVTILEIWPGWRTSGILLLRTIS